MARNQKNKSLQALADFQNIFATDPGKRVLGALIAESELFSPRAITDPHEALFVAGKRALMNQILGTLRMKPDQITALYDQYEGEIA